MAQMTAASIDDLPDSAFAYIEPGGTKDSTGRTTPRSLRHFPIHDEAHVRNALARLSQSPFGAKARPKVEAAARKFGIGAPAGKSLMELKAEPLATKAYDRWMAGEVSRRLLVLPYGGTIPSEKSSLGVDLDGEWFDADTDYFGPFPALRESRRRVVDWHHDDAGVPKGRAWMKGRIFGEVELDEEPEDDGLWADWWINVGEERRKRFAELERRGQQLFGSSQAVFKAVSPDGHIDTWPIYRHTITTSPQNRLAVVPPLKGMFDDLTPDDLTGDAIKALLVGLTALVPDLYSTFTDEATGRSSDGPSDLPVDAAKAGRVLSAANEARLRKMLETLTEIIATQYPLDLSTEEIPT